MAARKAKRVPPAVVSQPPDFATMLSQTLDRVAWEKMLAQGGPVPGVYYAYADGAEAALLLPAEAYAWIRRVSEISERFDMVEARAEDGQDAACRVETIEAEVVALRAEVAALKEHLQAMLAPAPVPGADFAASLGVEAPPVHVDEWMPPDPEPEPWPRKRRRRDHAPKAGR